ncbi:MAG: histidine phosphatase family protein [Acidimicrobiales bacterium]
MLELMWIVRHGESTWNARDLVQGQAPGPVLSRRGRHQARAAARLIAGAPVSAVIASDLERALQTAEPIARALGLPVRTDKRLRERALGVAEGRPAALLDPESSGTRAGRVVDSDAAPPGGESVAELYRRVTACMTELAEETEPLVVTHGGVVRVLFAWTAGTAPEEMPWGPVANGRVQWWAMPSAVARAARPGPVREVEAQR